MADHTHELKATFSVWSASATTTTSTSTSAAMAQPPSVKLHFVCNAIHRYVILDNETQIATQSQPIMAYRAPGRFYSSTKVDRSMLLSNDSLAPFGEIVLSKLLEYYGDVLLEWSGLESLVFDIVMSARSLILGNATNRVRVHVDFLYYHVFYEFDDYGGNYGMKPASKSATMEMLKKVDCSDKNNLCDDDDDDDERCTVCLEELMGSEDKEVLCMPCLHKFHGECILKWLENSHYCPICRFKMPTQ